MAKTSRKLALEFVERQIKQQALDAIEAILKPKGGRSAAPVWTPFPNSPQELAYHHPADELFYGGSGGAGKTDLLLGLAGTAHDRTLILRREFPRTRAIIERSREIFARGVDVHAKDSYNESLHLWRLKDGRTIEIGSVQYEKDWLKYQGQAHDLKAYDEITEFTEKQFRSINIWNRNLDPEATHRCRVVATGNPPTTVEGEWVINYWAPFIDEDHPNPASPGSLVWHVRIKDGDEDKDLEIGRTSLEEVLDSIKNKREIERPVYEYKGKLLVGRSRSFVPGKVEDNPVLMSQGYDKQLDALPEDLRVRFREGKFIRVVESQELQIIPTAWVLAAMERWKRFMGTEELLDTKAAIAIYKQKNWQAKQTKIGCDPARGGEDETCVAPRYGDWFAPVLTVPGKQTPEGRDVAMLIGSIREDDSVINIDVIGIGSSPHDACKDAGWPTVGMSSGESAVNVNGQPLRDRSGLLRFANKRALWIWKFMEMLDPQYGCDIMLPPDPKLKVDLCSFRRCSVDGGVIRVEKKEEIKSRIGRSPDRGESVILASLETYVEFEMATASRKRINTQW